MSRSVVTRGKIQPSPHAMLRPGERALRTGVRARGGQLDRDATADECSTSLLRRWRSLSRSRVRSRRAGMATHISHSIKRGMVTTVKDSRTRVLPFSGMSSICHSTESGYGPLGMVRQMSFRGSSAETISLSRFRSGLGRRDVPDRPAVGAHLQASQ